MLMWKHEKQNSEKAVSMLLLNLTLKCFFCFKILNRVKLNPFFTVKSLVNRAIVRKDSKTNILEHECSECLHNNSDFQ